MIPSGHVLITFSRKADRRSREPRKEFAGSAAGSIGVSPFTRFPGFYHGDFPTRSTSSRPPAISFPRNGKIRIAVKTTGEAHGGEPDDGDDGPAGARGVRPRAAGRDGGPVRPLGPPGRGRLGAFRRE